MRRYLFLQYERPLGAAVLATPLIETLRRADPDARIVVACGAMAQRVLAHNPHIDSLIATADPIDRPLAAAWQVVRRIGWAADIFDAVIADASNRSARIMFLAHLVRARRRIGFTAPRTRFDVARNYDPETGVLAGNLALASELGIEAAPCEPRIYFMPDDDAAAARFARDNGLDGDAPVIAVATQFSGGHPEKRGWRSERFAAVADALVARHGCRIVFLGTQSEAGAIDAIRGRMTSASASAAGRFDIAQLAAFLARCDMLLTLDTGPLHVARAVGLPAVIVARPWQPLREWLPLGMPGYTILSKDDEVRRSRVDPGYDAPSTIDEIGVDETVAALEARLGSISPASRATRVAAGLVERI